MIGGSSCTGVSTSTGVAYIWNQNTVRAWGPTRASTVTYITPVVGVALGALILGEQLSWNEPVGALVVFLGILLAQDRLRSPGRRNDEGADAASASAPPVAEISPAAARPADQA